MDKPGYKVISIIAGLAVTFLITVTPVFAQSGDVKSISQPGGNPIAGREKSRLCQGCHGEYGYSAEGLIPNLAGQLAPYIAKQILNYQAGTRTHPIMSGIMNTVTSSLTDAEIEALVEYISGQQYRISDAAY